LEKEFAPKRHIKSEEKKLIMKIGSLNSQREVLRRQNEIELEIPKLKTKSKNLNNKIKNQQKNIQDVINQRQKLSDEFSETQENHQIWNDSLTNKNNQIQEYNSEISELKKKIKSIDKSFISLKNQYTLNVNLFKKKNYLEIKENQRIQKEKFQTKKNKEKEKMFELSSNSFRTQELNLWMSMSSDDEEEYNPYESEIESVNELIEYLNTIKVIQSSKSNPRFFIG
jgi:chromosome segregation ATPase